MSAAPLYRLRFADGHEADLRSDALVWVVGRHVAADCWRRVSELKAGDRVALTGGATPDAPLRLVESVERLPRGRAGGGRRRKT